MGNQKQLIVSNTIMGALPPKNSLALYLEVFRTVIKSVQNRIQHALGFNSCSEGSYYRISHVFIGCALSTMYCMQAFLSTDLCYQVDMCFETHKWKILVILFLWYRDSEKHWHTVHFQCKRELHVCTGNEQCAKKKVPIVLAPFSWT